MFMLLYYEPNVNQSDIAKACFMNRSGVSRAFSDFEKKGLIKREINPNNKREYITTLTQKGLETAKFLEEKEIEWDNMICEGCKHLKPCAKATANGMEYGFVCTANAQEVELPKYQRSSLHLVLLTTEEPALGS